VVNLEKTAKEIHVCLTVSESKTRYMEVTNRPTIMPYFHVHNCNFEKVADFKHVGTLITSSNNLTLKINNRIVMTKKCYYGLKRRLRTHYLNNELNVDYVKNF
jgi:hypothetical protein